MTFLSAYAVVALGAEAATALVLWRRAAIEATGAFGILAAAYAVATVCIAVNAAALIGVTPLDPFAPATWLWWHALVPLGVLLALGFGGGVLRRRLLVAGTAIALVFVAASLFDPSPLLRVTNPTRGLSPGAELVAALGIVLDLVAFAALVRSAAFTPTLRRWILVAIAALALDQTLTLFGGPRFGPEWYAARTLGIVASCAVLFGYVRDTFARLARLEGSLREMRVFRDVAQTLPHLVWAVDGNGDLEWCNDRWYAYTGQSPARARGAGWRAAYHPDDALIVVRRWLDAIASDRPFQADVRIRGRDATYRWFELNARPLRDAGRTTVRWYVSHTDVDVTRRYVEALRSAFVPAPLPSLAGIALRGAYRPPASPSAISGAWYDAFVLADGRVGFTIGDVAGGDVDAATAMLQVRETLRAGLMLSYAPAEALAAADRELASRSAIASAFVGLLDATSGRVTFASAGRRIATIAKGGMHAPLGSSAAPLGTAVAAAREDAVVLAGDDTLLLSTHDAIGAAADTEAIAAAAEQLHEGVAVLALTLARERVDAAGWRFSTDDAVTAERARPAFVAYLAGRGLAGDALGAAEAVFGELVGNVVRHAPGPIEVDLRATGEGYLLAVRDRGAGFAPPPPLLPDELAESGRGLFLVSVLGSPPVVQRRPDGGAEVRVLLAPSV
jgi:PAS domain S-box-containing protein